MRAFETRKMCNCAHVIWSPNPVFEHNSFDKMFAQNQKIYSDAFLILQLSIVNKSLKPTRSHRPEDSRYKVENSKTMNPRCKRVYMQRGEWKSFSPHTNRLQWDTVFLWMIFLWVFESKDYITHEPLLIFNSSFALFSRVYCLRIKKANELSRLLSLSSNNSWSTRIVYISISIGCFYVLCSFLPHHLKDFWELLSDLKIKRKCSV